MATHPSTSVMASLKETSSLEIFSAQQTLNVVRVVSTGAVLTPHAQQTMFLITHMAITEGQ